MQKTPFVFPIIGGRKVEHLLANIEALELSLTDEQIKFLENVVEFQPGFPNWLIVRLTVINFSFSPTERFGDRETERKQTASSRRSLTLTRGRLSRLFVLRGSSNLQHVVMYY